MPAFLFEENDICIYVTEACNSNCIMCPMSLDARKRGNSILPEQWSKFREFIPADAPHVTITGGEPFLEYKYLIPAIRDITMYYPNTNVLILTNGRALSLKPLFQKIEPYLTDKYFIAVPIHAPNAELHDRITRTAGSFAEAMNGLRMLKQTPAKIEIRIVAHRYYSQFYKPKRTAGSGISCRQ